MKKLEEIEKEAILQRLEYYNGNISKTAISLAINRQTIVSKLKKWNVK